MSEKQIALEEYPMDWIVRLCGAEDKNLDIIREQFHCDIIMRDNTLTILHGEQGVSETVERVVKALFDMMKHTIDVTQRDILYVCQLAQL